MGAVLRVAAAAGFDPDLGFWGREACARARHTGANDRHAPAVPGRDLVPDRDGLRLERLACLVGGAVVLLSFALVGPRRPRRTSCPSCSASTSWCVEVVRRGDVPGPGAGPAVPRGHRPNERRSRQHGCPATVVLAATGGVLAISQVVLRRTLVVEVAFLALGVLLATAAMTSGGI
ncbi:MAG TPA: hypothetical protein VIL48_03085 [Acidimicrobiales bacterium]